MDSLDPFWRSNTVPLVAVGRERLAGFGINVAPADGSPGKCIKSMMGEDSWLSRWSDYPSATVVSAREAANRGRVPLVEFSIRIDSSLARTVEDYCRDRGIVKSRFVAQLLLDHLEDLEDSEEVERRMTEPTRSLQDVLRTLNLDREALGPQREERRAGVEDHLVANS